MPLRIGFDGRTLVSPAAGVRRYVRELFGAIAALDDDLEVVAVGAPAEARLPAHVAARHAAPSLPTNLGWSVSGLPLSARRARLGLFHAPAYTAPLWGVHPLVLTIHDVSYERRPEWYPYRRDPLRRAFYRRSALAADRIVTDSAFSRDEIAEAYGIAAERITVVPLGVGAPFLDPEPQAPSSRPQAPNPMPQSPGPRRPASGLDSQAPGPRPPASARGIHARFDEAPPKLAALAASEGGQAPFVLHVGDLHLRRNVRTALDAVIYVRCRCRPLKDLRILLAGVDRGEWVGLRARAAEAGHPDAAEHLATPSDADLAALYRRAGALVYPSRYEGFGLPILEAMACGTPVIAARTGSIPAVAGTAAILLDPDDVEGFGDAIEQVLLSSGTAARLSADGRERAARFTWHRAAALTLEAYREVLGR